MAVVISTPRQGVLPRIKRAARRAFGVPRRALLNGQRVILINGIVVHTDTSGTG